MQISSHAIDGLLILLVRHDVIKKENINFANPIFSSKSNVICYTNVYFK